MAEANSDEFEALRIRPDQADSWYFDFSVCQLGTFITAGRSSKVTVWIEDSDDIRCLSAHLNHLKGSKYDGLVQVTFNEDKYYTMDQSLWGELADGLFAISISVDYAKFNL